MNESKIKRVLQSYLHIVIAIFLGLIAILEGIRLRHELPYESFISGPGGYVFIVGIALLLFSLMSIINLQRKSLKEKSKNDKCQSGQESMQGNLAAGKPQNLFPTCLSFLLCIIYVALIKPLGFTLASIFYLASSLLLLRNSKKITILTCIVMIPILYLGFPAIGISVPKGILGF